MASGADVGAAVTADHWSTSGDRGFETASLGAALVVTAPPLGLAFLALDGCPVGERSRVGTMVGHLWHNVPKADLRRMSELLEATQAALVIVSIGGTARDLAGLVSDTSSAIITETDAADLELPTSVEDPSWPRTRPTARR